MTAPGPHPDRPAIDVDVHQMESASTDVPIIAMVRAIERVFGSRRFTVRRRLSAWQGVWWWEVWDPEDTDVGLTMSLTLTHDLGNDPNFIPPATRRLVIDGDGGPGVLVLTDPLATTVTDVLTALLRNFSIHRQF